MTPEERALRAQREAAERARCNDADRITAAKDHRDGLVTDLDRTTKAATILQATASLLGTASGGGLFALITAGHTLLTTAALALATATVGGAFVTIVNVNRVRIAPGAAVQAAGWPALLSLSDEQVERYLDDQARDLAGMYRRHAQALLPIVEERFRRITLARRQLLAIVPIIVLAAILYLFRL